jgi:hypothetical protein
MIKLRNLAVLLALSSVAALPACSRSDRVTPLSQAQPDIQYLFNSGAGAPTPNNANVRVKNRLILGLRTDILF